MPTDCDFAPGDATGIAIPAHPAALRKSGTDWLTEAFRAYGAMAPDNRVTAVRTQDFSGGNSGQKLLLSLSYARPEPDLHEELFVKFSRDFGDPFRDRRRGELEAEVHLASLSRLPAFPVPVAKAYFADFHKESGTGILITRKIPFGSGAILPLLRKNMDHELDNPLEYYQATVAAQARLAAAHHAGLLSPRVEELFPLERATASSEMPIPWDAIQMREKVRRIVAFWEQHPQFFPERVRTASFAERLERDAADFLERETALRRFLYANPDFIALTHWNTHIDNAWFWRDDRGAMQCGLLDWGMVRQMNSGFGLWGGLSGANADFLHRNLDSLLALFRQELRAHDGPCLDASELALHFDISVMLLGLALLMDAPALLLSRMPDLRDTAGLHDPKLSRDMVVQGFLHTFVALLSVWQQRDFGTSLQLASERAGQYAGSPAPPAQTAVPDT